MHRCHPTDECWASVEYTVLLIPSLPLLALGSTAIQKHKCLYRFFPESGRRGVPTTVKARESSCPPCRCSALGKEGQTSARRQLLPAHRCFLVGAAPPIFLCAAFQTAFSVKRPGASQVALVEKNPSANAGDLRDIKGIKHPGCPGGGHGNPLQCSHLENPMDRSLEGYSHGVTKIQTQLK